MASEDIPRATFAALVNEAEEMHKGPDIFWRKPRPDMNELRILRRWNSHSPSVADVLGGGYFLRWQGKGTIVDPGCSFLRLFRRWTKYSFRDVNMVIVTHDHIDHCQDLGTLISLFRQFNRWLVEKSGEVPRTWDMIVSYGVAGQFMSLLNHPDNAPFVLWRRLFAGGRAIDASQDIPRFLKSAEECNLLSEEPYLHAYARRASMLLSDRMSYELRALPTEHKELLGASTGFGLRFELLRKSNGTGPLERACTVVITGDTALHNEMELLRHYGDTDVLVLHVGTMEQSGKAYTGDHLCFQGVVAILDAIARSSLKVPKLVVLTEWGYEFGRLGLHGRTRFTRYVTEEANRRVGKTRFHAAVPNINGKPVVCPDDSIVVLPADISLRIGLPDVTVFAEYQAKNTFVDCKQVYASESTEQINYCSVCQ